MKVFCVRGANIVVGNRRHSFAPLIPLDVPEETGDYLLSTGMFFKEGEIPDEKRAHEESQKPFRIGVYRVGGFGDALLGSCVITALKRKYPKARIIAHTHSTVQSIWSGHPCLHHVDTGYRPRMNASPYVRHGYDAFFDLMPDCHAEYNPTTIPPETIVRHKVARAEIDRYKAMPGVPNHLKPFCRDKNFEALDVYNFLYGTDATIKDMHFPIKPTDTTVVARYQNEGLLPPAYITIHDWAFNGRQTKSWYPDYWRELNEKLRKHFSLPIVQLGGATEEYLHADFDLRGKTTFGESVEILKRSFLHVDNESTTAHVCPAIGTPCVVLCGPTLPYWRHKENINIVSAHPCQECEGVTNWYNNCMDRGSMGCMRSITPSIVMSRIMKTIKA